MRRNLKVFLALLLAVALMGCTVAASAEAPAAADGLAEVNGEWQLWIGGAFAGGYTGLWNDPALGWWLVKDGKVAFGYTGLYNDTNYGWWLINDARVNFEFSGVWEEPGLGFWTINKGQLIGPADQVPAIADGLHEDGGVWHLYMNGQIAAWYSGLYCDANLGWWLVENGNVVPYTGLYCDVNAGWWLLNNGTIAWDYSGLWNDPVFGWWLIGKGTIAWDYSGLWNDPAYGWWLVEKGRPDFSYTGMYEDANVGWWLLYEGSIAWNYTGSWNDPQYGEWEVIAGHGEKRKEGKQSGDLIRVGIIHLDPNESSYREKNVNDLKNTFTASNGYDAVFIKAPEYDDNWNERVNQQTAARGLIAAGVDYLLISAAETSGWNEVLQEAKDAGIGVFLYDRMIDADPSLYLAAVVSDMAREGQQAVDWLASLGLNEYRILHIKGGIGTSAQIGRSGALENKCAADGKWTIVHEGTGGFSWDPEEAYMITKTAINSGISFNVIYAENDGMAAGAVQALDEAGITHGVGGDVIIMGFDSNKWALRKLLAGEWNYDGQCSPFQAAPIDRMIKTLEAGGAIQGLNEEKQYINEEIGFDARTITAADVEYYGLGE